MALLRQFISALLQHDEVTWHAWACDFAEQVAEGRSPVPLPVRQPLFQRVLLPALSAAIAKETRGSARTLACFETELWHSEPEPLPVGLQTLSGLLREALRVDPADVVARRRLIDSIRFDLEYAIHELPAGVRWGANSASASQCEVLFEDLKEFRGYLVALREVGDEELCDACELHFTAYRAYLIHGRSAGSYERFLASYLRQ